MDKKRELNKLVSPLAIDNGFRNDIWVGIGISSLAMLCIFAISLSLGLISIQSIGFNIKNFLYYTGLILIAAGWEELLYRVIVLRLLMRVTKVPWLALVLTSVMFGLVHGTNDHASWLSMMSNGLGGFIYGLAFVCTRKIWLPWSLHFAWNYVQGFILGYPVSSYIVEGMIKLKILDQSWLSGGFYGPEGGIVGVAFRFLILSLLLVWIKRSRGSIKRNLKSVDYE